MSENLNHNDPSPEDFALDAVSERMLDATRRQLESVVEPRVLVTRGLIEAGEDAALTEHERAAATHPDVDNALDGHPVLMDVVARFKEDARLFNQVWEDELSGDRRPSAAPRRRRMRWPARLAMGASAAALVAVLYLAFGEQVGQTHVTAPATASQLVTLDDGSTVRLAPGASLTLNNRRQRQVTLEGTAFFDIDTRQQGFVVRTAVANATVLGTRFVVESTAQATEVVLVSGRVAVASRRNVDQMVILEPGEWTRVDAGEAPAQAAATDVNDALAWTGMLVFRDTRMEHVASAIKSTRGVEVEIDPELGAERVTGTFEQDQPAQEVVRILASTLGAEVVVTEHGFRIERGQ